MLAALIFLWQFLSTNYLALQFILPTPDSVGAELFRSNVNWASQILTTLKEILVGFSIGAVGGLALAVIISSSSLLRSILLPYLVGIDALPKIAIAPLIYILLGFNEVARFFMVTLLAFFPVVLTTLSGFTDVDRNLVYLMKSLGASPRMILIKVTLPSAMPQFFVGLRLAVLGSVIGSIIAEFVSSTAGLGFLIISAQSNYNTGLAFAALIVLTALSLGLYGIIEVATRLTMPWFRGK